MNNDVIATCAVIGSTDIAGMHPDLPITLEQIAAAVGAAASASPAGDVSSGAARVRTGKLDLKPFFAEMDLSGTGYIR